MMEEALRQKLLDHMQLAILVSERIAWGRRPDQNLPSITLSRLGGREEYAMEGAAGLTESVVQVDCWGRTYSEAKRVARAVILALPSRFTAGGVTLTGVFNTTQADSFEGDEPFSLFRTRLTYSIWHHEGASQ